MKKRKKPPTKLRKVYTVAKLYEQTPEFAALSRRNVPARLKTGQTLPRKQKHRAGQTKTVSFSLTREIDQLIEDLATDQHASRSQIIRQAVCVYADRLEVFNVETET